MGNLTSESILVGFAVIFLTFVNSLLFIDNYEYSVDVSDVIFYLYTRDNPDVPDKISLHDLNDLESSHYRPSLPNYFIIHGLFGNRETLDLDIRPPLLDAGDVNVFVVDYSGPASSITIHDLAIVGVGRILADYISKMKNKFLLSEDHFNVVGHSMGAHVSGEIGRDLNGTIGTIVAIDPPDMTPPIVYVNANKARYVQVIHTSVMGLKEQLGHLDFYPNGILAQPGCYGEVICAHFKGVRFYAESIRSGGFTAVKCDSYLDYVLGNCENNSEAQLGGFNLDKSSTGTYYLITNSEAPYSMD
ncbi:lipase member H-A-like [Agrilus planipennis]|uniref:Lipase member H-A-like n=1 Tax=Agrilus planipennis TaxID=224129 RepID=A0A7F5R2Z8_AGRPL|nr:lipase member H-A-like [Agrilus planipennis]